MGKKLLLVALDFSAYLVRKTRSTPFKALLLAVDRGYCQLDPRVFNMFTIEIMTKT